MEIDASKAYQIRGVEAIFGKKMKMEFDASKAYQIRGLQAIFDKK